MDPGVGFPVDRSQGKTQTTIHTPIHTSDEVRVNSKPQHSLTPNTHTSLFQTAKQMLTWTDL